MSDERDELADVIKPAAAHDYWPQKAAELALAAGYRKPRQVTTALALEEVPKGTLVLAANGEVWRKYTHKWDNLDETGDLLYPPHYIQLPATVLHVGATQ